MRLAFAPAAGYPTSHGLAGVVMKPRFSRMKKADFERWKEQLSCGFGKAVRAVEVDLARAEKGSTVDPWVQFIQAVENTTGKIIERGGNDEDTIKHVARAIQEYATPQGTSKKLTLDFRIHFHVPPDNIRKVIRQIWRGFEYESARDPAHQFLCSEALAKLPFMSSNWRASLTLVYEGRRLPPLYEDLTQMV